MIWTGGSNLPFRLAAHRSFYTNTDTLKFPWSTYTEKSRGWKCVNYVYVMLEKQASQRIQFKFQYLYTMGFYNHNQIFQEQIL